MNERDKEDSSIYFKERLSNDASDRPANFGNMNEVQNDSMQQLSSRNEGVFKMKNQFHVAATQNRKGLNTNDFDGNNRNVVNPQK